MTRSQWGRLTLTLLIGALVLIVALVVLVDPFEVYHKATAFIPPIESGTQSYSNAGIAKTYDYDSIIIGSSMTENFRPSQLDAALGGRFVKLCVKGGTPDDAVAALKAATKEALATDTWQEFVRANAANRIFEQYTTDEEIKGFYDHWQSVVCWMQYDAGVAPVSPETYGIERP